MRVLLLSTAAISLSACSFLGHGPSQSPYGHSVHTPPPPACAGQGSYHPSDSCRLSKFNLEGSIGKEFIASGSFTTPDDVAPLAGLTPGDVAMQEAYDAGTRFELGGSYALNPNRKVTLTGSYVRAQGNDVVLGSQANVLGSLRGTPSKYSAGGIELGLRQYFQPQPAPIFGSVRPYVEGRVGTAKVDDITIENLRDNTGPVNGGSAAFYQGGWIPMAAGMVGVEAPVFKNTTLALETGLRYRGALDADTTDFGPGGGTSLLTGINNGSSNVTVPVSLRARYRF